MAICWSLWVLNAMQAFPRSSSILLDLSLLSSLSCFVLLLDALYSRSLCLLLFDRMGLSINI